MTRLARIALTLLLALALAACGPGGSSTAQPGGADQPGGETPAPAASSGY